MWFLYKKEINIFFGAKHILCYIVVALNDDENQKKSLTKVFLIHELIDDVVGLKI